MKRLSVMILIAVTSLIGQSIKAETRDERIEAHTKRMQKIIELSRQRRAALENQTSETAGSVDNEAKRRRSMEVIEQLIHSRQQIKRNCSETTSSLTPERQQKIKEHTDRIDKIIQENERRISEWTSNTISQ